MWTNETQKRYLIFTLALVLILPMAISLHHHLLQHEVNICKAEGEQHVHEYHFSCDHEHFYNTVPGLEPGDGHHSLHEFPHYSPNLLNPRINDDPYLLLYEVRGPPQMTVS